MNRQVFPSSLFPLRGDISAEAGDTTITVTGIQGIPVISPPVEPMGLNTFFYDSYNNDWFYASPWDIPVGIPLVWEGYGYGSSGISWIAPDTLAFGNGTDGDVSGAAAMTALVLFGSQSYYGPYNDYDVDYGPSYDQFYTSIFSGATQNWNLILPPNPGTVGQVLTTNGTGVSYWSTIASSGGTVTSVGLATGSGASDALYTISGSPVTTSSTLVETLNTQAKNTFFGGPISGANATPTFRVLNSADIPVPGSTGDILYNNGGVLGASLSTITAAGSITLPDTQVILWSGAAYSGVGLSQLAADTLAVGNGTESDVSGGMAMTALILYGSSYYSAYDAFRTTIYSGATQNWNLVLPETAGTNGQVLVNIGSGFTEWEPPTAFGVAWSSLTNASANLTLANGTFTTTFNQTSNVAWLWANTSTGNSGSTNASPLLELQANYYTGSTSAADLWTMGMSLAAGTNGTSTLTFTHTGSTGAASVQVPGGTAAAPGLSLGAAGVGIANVTSNLQLCSGTGTISLISTGTSFGQLKTIANYLQAVSIGTNTGIELIGNVTTSPITCISLGNGPTNFTATSGSTFGVGIGTPTSTNAMTWNPASGSGLFAACNIAPTIEGTSSGNTYGLLVNPTITLAGLTGTNLIASFQRNGVQVVGIDYSGDVTLIEGGVLRWSGAAYSTVGISSIAADTLAVGNGNDGDISGGMAMTALILYGSSYYSAYDAFHTTIYSGATQNWNLVLPETAGLNGQVLTNIGSGFTEWKSLSSIGGVPSVLATSFLTAQTSAISGQSIVSSASAFAKGMWRISFVATQTTAGSAGTVLGGTTGFTITFTNANGDTISKTTALSAPATGVGTSTSDTISGDFYGYAGASTNITYSFGYTAGGVTGGAFDIAVYAEFLG